jgi:hypothetical protein
MALTLTWGRTVNIFGPGDNDIIAAFGAEAEMTEGLAGLVGEGITRIEGGPLAAVGHADDLEHDRDALHRAAGFIEHFNLYGLRNLQPGASDQELMPRPVSGVDQLVVPIGSRWSETGGG